MLQGVTRSTVVFTKTSLPSLSTNGWVTAGIQQPKAKSLSTPAIFSVENPLFGVSELSLATVPLTFGQKWPKEGFRPTAQAEISSGGFSPCQSCSDMSSIQPKVKTGIIVHFDVENPNLQEPAKQNDTLEKLGVERYNEGQCVFLHVYTWVHNCAQPVPSMIGLMFVIYSCATGHDSSSSVLWQVVPRASPSSCPSSCDCYISACVPARSKNVTPPQPPPPRGFSEGNVAAGPILGPGRQKNCLPDTWLIARPGNHLKSYRGVLAAAGAEGGDP